MKSCFFIGHREASEEIFPELAATVEEHITKYHVMEFVVGNYGAFDRMVARALLEAKHRYPEIFISLLLPYHPAVRPIELPPGFDSTFYPPDMENVPHRFSILRANRHMVDNADYLIAYAWHPASNARNLLEYAKKRERQGRIKVTVLTGH